MNMPGKLTLCLAFLLTAPSLAASDTVLTLSGAISDEEIKFTRDDLLGMSQQQLVTATTVTDGRSTFEGFLVRDLLEAHEADGEVVIARALNDYQIEIPISDFERFDVIGALSMDGVPLSPRDKGPIWIVYPRDDHPELQDIRYDTRWVWQLVSLHVQ
ncbi:molybdopterin-dependent oxidoreductase [Roseinatronobacter sp.]|uniref:molybdopterin-dependent oxidoreductase n=1 Tax=Roseinatronobacter sp. TaxID=1945755 RepID=UPI0025D51B3E|nr:molybdopterin-dependent oxidoreductase [Rhodobaca sp.]